MNGEPQIKFVCDASGCKVAPHRAPAIVVPHKLNGFAIFMGDNYQPIKMHTVVHFCEAHRITMDQQKLLDAILTTEVKVHFEKAAKMKRALDFKPDFENARLDWELVTTPEYRRYLAALGYAGVMGAARLTPDQQRMLRFQLGAAKVAG